ncbi:LysR family transcriptional regulator [Pseudonocardia acaciae]|uniref:LysR family transcriptional regulator n=1 Tax=Pseudonocardia acaciae TaxID=551276 RepID=UPI001B804FDE|nr:LysR family transcriptional regulator [Pseudonocardia acaciae]
MAVFDPVRLRSFATVARCLSFTRAAERLGLRQSTVSQHVRKLEAEVGRPLLARDTHSVALTPDGAAMLEFAGTILDTVDRARAHFGDSAVRGRLRFGMSEDLVLTRLPSILTEFRRRHPLVDLELTVDHTATLRALGDHRDLDLVFGKRMPGEAHGIRVWSDRFVWVAGPELPPLGRADRVPLVGYPAPSLSRDAAVTALEAAGRPWRMVCSSKSLNGVQAAALAGLGVFAHAESLIPPGLAVAPSSAGLPPLPGFDFMLSGGRAGLHGPAAALAHSIQHAALWTGGSAVTK